MNYPSHREDSDFAAGLPAFYEINTQFFGIPSSMEKL